MAESSMCSAADLRLRDCNTLLYKVPAVLPLAAGPPAATAALGADDRAAFEHLVGHALGETAAVRWATREFVRRLRRFIVEGAAMNGTSTNAALSAAFACATCGPNFTGYVGPSLEAIERALASGNLREVWALVYVLTRTRFFTTLLLTLLTPQLANHRPLATPETLAERFGFDSGALAARWALVEATQRTLASSKTLQLSQGVPTFEFQRFDSWVHMNFRSEA